MNNKIKMLKRKLDDLYTEQAIYYNEVDGTPIAIEKEIREIKKEIKKLKNANEKK